MKLTSESLTNIAPALVKAQAEMGNAVKDSKNPFFKSNYADLNAVREACLPAFNKHGISVLQPTVYVEGRKFVQTILVHESGEFFSGLTEVLSQKEGDAQAQGSGISYARRYGLQSLANIGAEDDDGNAATGKKQETNFRQTSATPAAAETKTGTITATAGAVVGAGSTGGSKSFRKNKPAQEEI